MLTKSLTLWSYRENVRSWSIRIDQNKLINFEQ